MLTKGFSNTASEANFDLALKGTNFLFGFYYANAAFNLILTLLIAGRIWWVVQQSRRAYLGNHYSLCDKKFKAIITVLLECGILYPISLIAHAVVEGNSDILSIPVDLTAVTIQLAVSYYTFSNFNSDMSNDI
ncbi:hypothetical protein GYMLUDRAFT_181521 [Collybiopsis luxurians FD-317 M1]|uniref:Uncharacterized protein n=1 Tax=Collybiopsis luxurians FD-317 M1 TaxID=944289 RepID=A0A0D0C0Y6_9AGAR|nr:hypothetical protein GYMLUDRAFT_181521 [Collybiopsis luxurians FD-317 M1]